MFIKKAKTFLLTCMLAFALCSLFTAKTFAQQATKLHVDNSVAMSGDGLSWATAKKTLWEALNTANLPGDWEIRVAQGTYTPEAQDLPFLITDKSGLEFGDSVVLLGGYAGIGAANPDLRDPKANPTILSGDILGVDPMQVGKSR